jgi:cell division septum initiation protein DivIVA
MTFWEQAREQAKRLFVRAEAESEKLARLARLNFELSSMRAKVERKTTELGTVTRKLVQEGDIVHADLSAVIAEIEALETRVKELEQQIAETKATTPARVE